MLAEILSGNITNNIKTRVLFNPEIKCATKT